MPTFTVSITKELKKRIDEHPEINWAEVVRRGIIKKVEELEKFEELKMKGAI